MSRRRQTLLGLCFVLGLTGPMPPIRADVGSIVGLAACELVPIECTPPGPNSGFTSVSTGNYHGMGLKTNGSVVSWGLCDVEQCVAPLPNAGFVAISGGDSHSLGLKADGSIAAWGSNDSGQLNLPAPNTGFVAIAAGALHNVALKADGSIVGWGSSPGSSPAPPAPNTGWVAVAAGSYYSIGLKSDGSLRRWGCGGPCALPSPNTGFVAVSTHHDHSLAVRTDGSIVAWGSNPYGQLDVPPPNTGFVAVAAGDHFSLGLKSDGSIAAWGEYDQSSIPLPNRGYLAVSANKGFAYALKSQATDPIFSEAPPISNASVQGIMAAAADVDGDGDEDLVSAEYGAGLVSWYENSGTAPPVWTKRTIDSFASGPQNVAAADVDDDGDLDLFSANFNQEGIVWYENSGAAPPQWTKRLISGISAWGLFAADVDGDGDIDGIGGNLFDEAPAHIGVEWYENDGGAPPHFTVRRVSPGFVEAASLNAADLDSDGDTDILSVDVFADTVHWFENDGATPPAWTQRAVTTTADEVFSVFAADLDRDGDMDVLSASSGDDKIAWYENDGSKPPVFTPHVITTSASRAIGVFAIDLDGDADVDVVSAARDDEIAWYESDGRTPPSFTRRVISNDCADPEGVFAARLDPDADVDILTACNHSGRIRWYPNNANFTESDGDGVRNDLDCAPADAAAFALPGEVRNLRYDTRNLLAWAPEATRSGSGTTYDVLRGSLAQLPVGSGASETCAGPGIAGTTLGETAVPAAGTGIYYVVRGTNSCGDGSYGFRSSGAERASTVCP